MRLGLKFSFQDPLYPHLAKVPQALKPEGLQRKRRGRGVDQGPSLNLTSARMAIGRHPASSRTPPSSTLRPVEEVEKVCGNSVLGGCGLFGCGLWKKGPTPDQVDRFTVSS